MTHETDIIVVGGGILGAFHAYAALQCGYRVTLLERHAKPRGATVRNFGQIVPSGMSRNWQRLGRKSLEVYESLQSKVDLSLRQLGTTYLASDREELGLLEELAAINRDEGYRSNLLTAAECKKQLPSVRSDYCVGGLSFPEEFSANPRQLIHRFLDYLKENPRCLVRFDSNVQSLVVDNSKLVLATTTAGDRFSGNKAVVCGGHEFSSLFPEVFRKSDLEVVKLQMLRLRSGTDVALPGNILTGRSIRRYESFSECESWNAVKSKEPDDSFAKRWGIHLLLKQESDGSIILGDSHEYAPACQSDKLGFDTRWDINEFFLDEARKIVDLPSWEIESSWSGIYCQAKNENGVFRSVIDDRIHIVTGIGGKGMTASPGYSQQSFAEIEHD
ncbi:MAG: TIGR03364 family FAD-dependent oxidoreductase [Planctomycetota bacterium]